MRLTLTTFDWYAYALPGGAYVVANTRPGAEGALLDTHLGTLNPGERILFPVIAPPPVFKIAGQTHADPPRVLEYVDSAAGHLSGWFLRDKRPSGTSPCIYDRAGQLHVAEPTSGNGSQGYRYAAEDGRLVTGDATYQPADGITLHGWTELSGWRVGQGPEIGCWAYRDGRYYDLAAAAAALHPDPAVAAQWRRALWQFVRFSVDGNRFALAAWVEHAPSVLLFGTLDEIATLPWVASLAVPAPTPSPLPEPPPTPTPPPTPEVPVSEIPTREIEAVAAEAKAEVEALGHVFKTVEEARRDDYAHYTMEDKQRSFLVTMRVAWKLAQRYPNVGVGLEAYPGHSGVPSPFPEDGPEKYSGPLLLWGKSGPSVQVLEAGVKPTARVDDTTNPQATINWQRDWRAPLNPYRGTSPAPVPVPLPPLPTPGNTPVTCNCDLAPVLERLDAIDAKLTALVDAIARLDVSEFPVYTGTARIWGQSTTFTLTPQEPES